jgi:butyrate kinase
MTRKYTILVINPGSTSTKIAVFENDRKILAKNLHHSEEELQKYERVPDQYQMRLQVIEEFLASQNMDEHHIDAVVGRGGLLHPLKGGTYLVNDKMIADLHAEVQGEHPCNLGGLIAYAFAQNLDIPAYIVDPVVVDEMDDIARLSGIPELPRKSIFHALNQKAIARRAAEVLHKSYFDVNLIVAHMGGGISIGAHQHGRVVDVNNALDGEGPYTPERSGTLPVGDLVRLCYSGKYTLAEMKKMIKGRGGVVAYLGTNDMRQVEERVASGDHEAIRIYKGMAFQIAKSIAAFAAVLNGMVDAVVLTGGIAFDTQFTKWIEDRVGFIAPVLIFPGEEELEALAQGTLRVLRGEEKALIYC